MFIGHLQEHHPAFQAFREPIVWGETDIRLILVMTIIQIALSLILLWGVASILVVGKRMLSTRAGRSRTSFKVVRKQASGYVLNIFITGILRACIALLWSFLLIIPGVIYYIRTSFYHITIVCEGDEYRKALNRSNDRVRCHTWITFCYLLGFFMAIFFPALIISGVLSQTMLFIDPRLVPALYIFESAIMSVAILLYVLSTVTLYRELKKLPAPIHGSITR